MPQMVRTGAARRYMRQLSYGLGTSSDALESVGESLSPRLAEGAHSKAISLIERESGREVDSKSRGELDRIFLQDGPEAIERLASDGEDADLTEDHQDALEAIVESDGSRPSLPVSDQDQIDLEDPTLGQWRVPAEQFAEQISKVASAVGRIDVNGKHCGTGFVVKENLVLTNRHVLQGLAKQSKSGKWTFRGQPSITFDANPKENRSRQFKIKKKVVLSGQDFIDLNSIDFRKLDFAVLECEVADGTDFPPPLPLENDVEKIVEERPIFTVGYPGKPKPGDYPFKVLHDLLQYRFGIKRFAPGEIDRGLGDSADETGDTVFTHDSTTLGGNSGSCVVDLGNDGLLVVGLHFAGAAGVANYAHSNARLQQTLAQLGLVWKAWL